MKRFGKIIASVLVLALLTSCGKGNTGTETSSEVTTAITGEVTTADAVTEEKTEASAEETASSETETEDVTEEKAEEKTEENSEATEQSSEKTSDEKADAEKADAAETVTDDASSMDFGEEDETEVATEMSYDPTMDASDFVVITDVIPDVILEIRYFSTYNFVGERIDGYEQPTALMTREAAEALKEVSDELKEQGYLLKIYDAYRPDTAVQHFVRWAQDPNDDKMKQYFYPDLDKSVLFPYGYISENSNHSRGSTVDLTLFDMKTEKDVDMGGTFDWFGDESHTDYKGITDEQYANRMILRNAMVNHGFKPIKVEWWHFTLENEPFPNTYFNFPVSEDSVTR